MVNERARVTGVAVEEGSKSRLCLLFPFSLMRLTPSSTGGLLVSFLVISVATAQPALESENTGVTSTHPEADITPVDPSLPGVSVRETSSHLLSPESLTNLNSARTDAAGRR